MKAILKIFVIRLLISTTALSCMELDPTNKTVKKELTQKKCDQCYNNTDTIRHMPITCFNPTNAKFICEACYRTIKAESKKCPYCTRKKFFSLFKRKK